MWKEYTAESPETLLSSWIDVISQYIDNDSNNPSTTYHDTHINLEVFFEKFNLIFYPVTFATSGSLNRSMKKLIENKNIKNVSTHSSRQKLKKRNTVITLRFSDSMYKSDMILYPGIVSDINDIRIQSVFSIVAPCNTPSKIPSKTPKQSSLQPSSPPQYTFIQPKQSSSQSSSLEPKQSSSQSSSPPQYPFLQSIGIESNFDNEENVNKIEYLLAELVSIHKKNEKQLCFSHLGNGKPGLLVQVPRANSYIQYKKNERREHWLESSLEFIATNARKSAKNVEDVTTWLLKTIHLNNPTTFLQVATKLGLHVVQKMNKIEAAAMWTEANVSLRSARIILSHLNQKFKNRVQVPLQQVSLLSGITKKIQPIFKTFIYEKSESVNKKNKKKIKEKIQYWQYCIEDLLLCDYERFLESELPNFREFGYFSKAFSDKKGVIIIIGSDHGCGKSRFLIRTNYLDSKSRREVNKADYGTRTIQFAEVDCKKDVCLVHSKIAPGINVAIKKLETSKLVGVKYDKKKVKCSFIPLDATELRTSINDDGVIHVIYSLNGKDVDINLDIHHYNKNIPIEIITVIPMFKVVVAGDLSYFATCTGRDGHSHCRCPYCDASASEWNNPFLKPNVMTLPLLHHYATIHSTSTSKNDDTKGVIMPPLLEVDPHFYMVPILHLLIGLVNKEWITMLRFFDEFVENVSEKEADLKVKRDELKMKIDEIDTDLEILTVDKDESLIEMDASKEAKEIYDFSVQRIKSLTIEKKKNNHELRSVKASLKNEQEKRGHSDNTLENLLYLILEESQIQKQHFHGGAMNGVCCRRLLDNLDTIFPKIKALTSERLRLNKNRNYDVDLRVLTEVIDKFEYLFEITDLVFSGLRVLGPTEEEINETERAIAMLESTWKDLEIFVTPKAHILFDHTIDQMRFFEGISDLVEDFIERAHQIGKKLDHLVARMRSQGFQKQELAKIRRQWLSNDPEVLKQQSRVNISRKRKIADSPFVKTTKIVKAREVKRVKRERVKSLIDGNN